MPSKFCTKCGHEIAEGKQFCGGCGKPVVQGQRIQTPDRAEAPASVSGGAPCTQCGFAIPVGKRFCMKCGKAVGQIASVPASSVTAESRPVASQLHAQINSPANSVTPPPVSRLREGISSQFPPNAGISAPQAPAVREAEEVYAPASVSEQRRAQPRSTEKLPPLTPPKARLGKGQARIWLLTGASVALVAIVAVGVWFFVLHGKWPGLTASTQRSNAEAPITSPTAVTPPTAAKPSAAAPVAAPQPAMASQTGGATNSAQPPPARNVSSIQSHPAMPLPPPTQKTSTQLAAEPTPALLSPPAVPHSGDLHYTGHPIHFGEVVTFAHLPGGRLRFVFDHQSWQPLISRQSDGTQTLSLRSLKHADQTQCDVQWESAP